MTEMVKLKNGSEEATSLVATIMFSLRHLLANEPIAFYELVCLCRDRDHKTFGNTGKALGDLALTNYGQPHDSIRNIVLSAVVGEELEMRLGSPIAQEGDS